MIGAFPDSIMRSYPRRKDRILFLSLYPLTPAFSLRLSRMFELRVQWCASKMPLLVSKLLNCYKKALRVPKNTLRAKTSPCVKKHWKCPIFQIEAKWSSTNNLAIQNKFNCLSKCNKYIFSFRRALRLKIRPSVLQM